MADYIPAQEKCPTCGRDRITVDGRYGSDLKRKAFLGRTTGSFLALIGALALIFLQITPTDQIGAMVFSFAILLGFAWTLVVIIRAYRQVYGVSSAGRYPDARYTCNLCGHRWTSEELQIVVSHKADEREDSVGQAPQDTAEGLAAETPTSGPQGAQGFRRILATGASKFDWGNCLLIAVLLALLGVLGSFVLLGLLLR